MWKRWILPVLLLTVLPATWSAPRAQEPPPASELEIIERILELRREIERLVEELSPEAREELERRLTMVEPPVGSEAMEPAEGLPPQQAQDAEIGVSAPEAPAPMAAAPAPVEASGAPPEGHRRGRCNTLEAFDTNRDGVVSASDRYWRYLYLWIDGNGDGRVQEAELKSAFERRVRSISVRLDTFELGKKSTGLIRVGEALIFDLSGDGFASSDDAVLAVDATALSRGTGPRLLSAEDEPLEGIQPFRGGWKLRDSSGEVTELSCP